MAEKLGNPLHTVSHAQLALLRALETFCCQEGSTHGVWWEISAEARRLMQGLPGAHPSCLQPSCCASVSFKTPAAALEKRCR